MQWTTDRQYHQTVTVLALSEDEIPVIAKHLLPVLKKLQTKFDKLQDIHESGEATEAQEDQRTNTREELETIQQFCKEAEWLKEHEKRIESLKQLKSNHLKI